MFFAKNLKISGGGRHFDHGLGGAAAASRSVFITLLLLIITIISLMVPMWRGR
jgi:hypothetical protein